MSSEPDNIDRATWARKALNVFADETFCGRSFDELLIDDSTDQGNAFSSLHDLIGDLLHLAHQQGWDVDKVVRYAVGNFKEELAEDGGEED